MTTKNSLQHILIVDFGGQYAQLIVRMIRYAGVHAVIAPYQVAYERIRRFKPAGVIMSGGPASVVDPSSPLVDRAIFSLGIPTLGICYGHQLMAQLLGGTVEHGRREHGLTSLCVIADGVLLGDWSGRAVLMSHVDAVTSAPSGFRVTATTRNAPVAAMESVEKRLFGIQFHPEVADTSAGRDIVERFIFTICGLRRTRTPDTTISDAVERIRAQVHNGRVLCAVSGGVDSTVMAALVQRAVGRRAIGVFVDSGLLRRGEKDDALEVLRRSLQLDVVYVDRSGFFLDALSREVDPEKKRIAVGSEFIRSFQTINTDLSLGAGFLAQGTLQSDVIESGAGGSRRIKTHHNVGGLPRQMDMELVEPLRNFFKDDVRRIAEQLHLPSDVVRRQTFPGPGLAIRILGEVTSERLEVLRVADWIVREEIEQRCLQHGLFSYFAVLWDAGVRRSDRGRGSFCIVVRAVTSDDAMTAQPQALRYEVLSAISSRILAELPSVRRVVYDITGKPPATIEWE